MKSSLELREISAGYDNKPAIRNINLTVNAGELLVLAGPNGSGKSTLLKTAGGLITPMEGKVAINGREVRHLKPRQRATLTAFLFQVRDRPWAFTVRETVAQGCFARRGWLGAETKTDRDAVTVALEKAELAALAERPVTELSGGELQRVYIARCIAQGADFLLLDEPDNNLDPKYSFMILTLLSELAREGRGIIVSLHNLRLASRFADRIALLSASALGGTLNERSFQSSISALGAPAEVLTEENLGNVYDLKADLVRDLII